MTIVDRAAPIRLHKDKAPISEPEGFKKEKEAMGGGDSSSIYANKLTFDHHDEIMKRSEAVNVTGT